MECYKICFTKKQAKTALNGIKRHRGKEYRKEVRMYECPEHLGCWHLTSQEEYDEILPLKIEELKYQEKWKQLME